MLANILEICGWDLELYDR